MDDEKIIEIMQYAGDTGDFAQGCDELKALIASYTEKEVEKALAEQEEPFKYKKIGGKQNLSEEDNE